MALAVVVVLGGLAALAAATGALARTPATASAAVTPTVRVAQTLLGKILVDGSGATLYVFTRDRRNKDTCAHVSGCLGVWPALTTTNKPTGGPKVRSSLLGSIELHGKVRQVTYRGRPLYTYELDFGLRSTLYIGTREYGGWWYALDAAGKPVK
jgi:predicted lipoprotein with Yx(FWY)xxD motif